MAFGAVWSIGQPKLFERDLDKLAEDDPTKWNTENRLRLIEERHLIGTWAWFIKEARMEWSPGVFRLLGVEAHAVQPSFGAIEAMVHPEDRGIITRIRSFSSDTRTISQGFRIIRPDGGLRWLHVVRKVVANRAGEPNSLVGIIEDVTELETNRLALNDFENWVHAAATALEIDFWKLDIEGNLLSSLSSEHGLPVPSDQFSNITWRERLHPDDSDALVRNWSSGISNQVPFCTTFRVIVEGGNVETRYLYGYPRLHHPSEADHVVGIVSKKATIIFRVEPEHPRAVRLSAGQVRAARAYLNLSAGKLAENCKLSTTTIRRMETDDSYSARPENHAIVLSVFRNMGINVETDSAGEIVLKL